MKDGCLNPGVVHPELCGEVDPERQETHYPVVEEEEGGSVHKQIQQHKHSFIETVSGNSLYGQLYHKEIQHY